MSNFRTSRILQLLLATAMLVGPVLPLVQVLCGMESPMAESQSMAMHTQEGIGQAADMPCPAHSAASSREDGVNAGEDDAANLPPESAPHDCPMCDVVRDAYRTCCRSAAATIAAALPVKYSEHTADLFATVSQFPSIAEAPAEVRVPPEAASFAGPIPSPANHQALLATFLI